MERENIGIAVHGRLYVGREDIAWAKMQEEASGTAHCA
jgi:hypothetical protein